MMFLPLLAGLVQSPVIGHPAPDLIGGPWLNVEKPVAKSDYLGHVTVIHFWTFACSNCAANMPRYNKWYETYAKRGVKFVGIHTPELKMELDERAVKKAIGRYGAQYPVLVDNDGKNWKAWRQEFWPAVYILDKKGVVRYEWEGELEYQNRGGDATCRKVIDRLMAER